jgi:hydroxypyruvate isomerase
MEGNLIASILAGKDRIAYFHVAGNPGRNEPDIGEINYPGVINAIIGTGYNGVIGLEYFPLGEPISSLINTAQKLPKSRR